MNKNILESIQNLLPKYTLILPLTQKEVTFTPFRVMDAKNLSVVLQEDNKKLAFMAMVDIVKRNVTDINVNDLCLAEVEYLFLHIRSKSVDEKLNLIRHDEKIQLYIGDVFLRNTCLEQSINVSNDVNLILKTPTVSDLIKLESFDKNNLVKCIIKKIIVKNEIFYTQKFLPKELESLIDNLPLNILSQFDSFFNKQPELYATIETKDGSKEVNGFLNFFTYR
jgi:hypothetical protein